MPALIVVSRLPASPARQPISGLIHPCPTAHTECDTCRPQNGRNRGDQSVTHMFSFSQANNRGSGPVASQSQICSGRSTNCPSQAAQAPLMTDENENDDEGAWLQLRPVEPLPSQCCGSGCSPCVFDLYHRELARWEAARASKDRSLLNGEEPQVREHCSSDKKGQGGSVSLASALHSAPVWGSFS